MMATVAIAGGSGKLGRAIVDGIKSAGKFNVVALARQADDAKAQEIGARLVALDYTDADAIATVLEKNNIQTVVSALSRQSPPEQELNLIKGADKSSVTKRFIPSNWGMRCTKEIASYFPPAATKLTYLDALKSTSLEWTTVINGFFLDYYCAPKVKTYMAPMALAIDLPNNCAAIPGSGDVPVVFTHTFDIGKFVAALLTQAKWEEESYIIGDKLTLNEFVKIGEEVKKTKFTIEHDPVEKLKTGQVTELPSHPSFYPYLPKQTLQGMFSTFGLMFENGVFDLQPAHTLNEDFPQLKPRTVKEVVSEAYGV